MGTTADSLDRLPCQSIEAVESPHGVFRRFAIVPERQRKLELLAKMPRPYRYTGREIHFAKALAVLHDEDKTSN